MPPYYLGYWPTLPVLNSQVLGWEDGQGTSGPSLAWVLGVSSQVGSGVLFTSKLRVLYTARPEALFLSRSGVLFTLVVWGLVPAQVLGLVHVRVWGLVLSPGSLIWKTRVFLFLLFLAILSSLGTRILVYLALVLLYVGFGALVAGLKVSPSSGPRPFQCQEATEKTKLLHASVLPPSPGARWRHYAGGSSMPWC